MAYLKREKAYGGRRRGKLAELGLTLPDVVPPRARTSRPCGPGVYVYTAGQLPIVDGKLPVPARSAPR